MPLPFVLKQKVVPVVTRGGAKATLFPVRRIYCIGQNYESHAREMGGHTSKNNPFFFCKPTDSLVTVVTDAQGGAAVPSSSAASASPSALPADCNLSIRYPTVTESYHHEVELVVALGPRHSLLAKAAEGHRETAGELLDPLADENLSYTNICVEDAHDLIYGYSVGLDMTRRDLQVQAKENGKPWDLAKGADDAAVISPLVLASDLHATHPHLFTALSTPMSAAAAAATAEGTKAAVAAGDSAVVDLIAATTTTATAGNVLTGLDVKSGDIHLSVNGSARQKGNMDCMVNTPAEIISILSRLVTLHAGDLIYTGTPSGVGPVRRGDVISAGIEGIGEITVTVV